MSIKNGKTCPYCHRPTQYVDSSVVYGNSYGMIYYCAPCQAWVGVHKGTDKALGRLANKELRQWKQTAHKFFDPLWYKKTKLGYTKSKARHLAYKWLAGEMGISIKVAHIGMFDVDQCKRAIEICKRYYHESATIHNGSSQ